MNSEWCIVNISSLLNNESLFIILYSLFTFHYPLWAFQDSNLRPRPYQRRALTS